MQKSKVGDGEDGGKLSNEHQFYNHWCNITCVYCIVVDNGKRSRYLLYQ